jgi:hypothetical protein
LHKAQGKFTGDHRATLIVDFRIVKAPQHAFPDADPTRTICVSFRVSGPAVGDR